AGRIGFFADQVLVRDPREIDAARSRKPVPLPQARVDLTQAVAAVSRVALELDLRQPDVSERAQERQPLVDDLVDPHRLADPAPPDPPRRLPQLPSAEEAQRLAVAVEVAAERVELLVTAGDPLLDERLVLGGLRGGALGLGPRLAGGSAAPARP